MRKLVMIALTISIMALFSGCLLPDDKYSRLKEDYLMVRQEVVKNWDKFPPEAQKAFVRIDKALVIYDHARGGIIKPLISIIAEAKKEVAKYESMKTQDIQSSSFAGGDHNQTK